MDLIDRQPEERTEERTETHACDLISRQAALKIVAKHIGVDGDRACLIDVGKTYGEIYALPSAQPDIIRCKDCKHYYFAENRVPEEQSWVCDVWHVNQTAHMGYCFKAERRTDE